MSPKINIPFTNKNIGGNKNVFQVLNDKQLNDNYEISTIPFLKIFESIMKKNNSKNNSKNNIFIKGSETKKYYQKLNKN
jgi:hypothetical protein